ncbi:hypothetical protein P8452_34757 [Trifolium repens]|nr:hypothetical protein P8452_34757 [Trifolium repens]
MASGPVNSSIQPGRLSCLLGSSCLQIHHVYLNIYGSTFRATSLHFSPECLINCIICVIRDKVLTNWHRKEKSYAYGTFQALCICTKYGIAALDDYKYNGNMFACKKYKPCQLVRTFSPITQAILSIKHWVEKCREVALNVVP